MAETGRTTGNIISQLADEPKRLIGRAILEGLSTGRFTFTNPLASEGGDYDQNQGDYTQGGGGTHDQGSGGYNQSKLVNNLGRLDVTDLGEIMGSIQSFDR